VKPSLAESTSVINLEMAKELDLVSAKMGANSLTEKLVGVNIDEYWGDKEKDLIIRRNNEKAFRQTTNKLGVAMAAHQKTHEI